MQYWNAISASRWHRHRSSSSLLHQALISWQYYSMLPYHTFIFMLCRRWCSILFFLYRDMQANNIDCEKTLQYNVAGVSVYATQFSILLWGRQMVVWWHGNGIVVMMLLVSCINACCSYIWSDDIYMKAYCFAEQEQYDWIVKSKA